MRHKKRLWMLVAGAMMLIAAHGVILYFWASHFTLSAAVVAGVIVLVVVKHFGVAGPLYAILRKAWRRS